MGWVVEARMTPSWGAVATSVKEGELKKGDIVLAGGAYGGPYNYGQHWGRPVKKATPSMPVEITGLDGIPQAGISFTALLTSIQPNRQRRKFAPSVGKSRWRSVYKLPSTISSAISKPAIKELNLLFGQTSRGRWMCWFAI